MPQALVSFVLLLVWADPLPSPQHLELLNRLDSWIRLVEAHEPGAIDESVRAIATSSLGLSADLVPLVSELGNYQDIDTLVRRAAMLYLDVAMSEVSTPVRPNLRNGVRPALVVEDARGQGTSATDPYIIIGRKLIGLIRPRRSDDPVPRLWYRATTAWLAHDYRLADLVDHLSDTVDIWRDDAQSRFDQAVMYETMAAPRVRTAIAMSSNPGRIAVPGERGSLALADRYFRHALRLEPTFVEARIRLGRVLGLRGRHDEAVEELQQALATAGEPVLRFDTRLFLARAEELRGDLAAAHDHYESARTLFPRAQSAALGLSRTLLATGRQAEAARVLDTLMADLPAGDADDPWWTYHEGIGRRVDDLMAELEARVKALAK